MLHGVAFAQRFIALTTDDKRGMLRRAWDAAPAGATTLLDQIKIFKGDSEDRANDDINSSSSNGHSASSNFPGQNKPTDTEDVRGWNQIIEGYKNVREFLRTCAKYGQNAFTVQCNGLFPSPLPAAITPPENRVLIDPNDQWAALADREDIDPALIVNTVVGEEAIYVWLLTNPNLLNISSNITESRGDYSRGIVGRGGMQ